MKYHVKAACWQAADKMRLGGLRGARTPRESAWQAVPLGLGCAGLALPRDPELAPLKCCYESASTSAAVKKWHWKRMESPREAEKWLAFPIPITALNIVFPFCVSFIRYLWSLLNSGVFYAQTEILETCIYDVWFETWHTFFFFVLGISKYGPFLPFYFTHGTVHFSSRERYLAKREKIYEFIVPMI